MTKFPVGALLNGEYCLPCNAVKGLKYTCPGCGEPVISKKGDVRIHHFAHKSGERDCKFYDHPGEGEIHKLVKHMIADLLRKKKIKKVVTKCRYRDDSNGCNNLNGHCRIRVYEGHVNYGIFETYDHLINYEEGDEIIIEYRVNEKCIVDVAIINNGRLKYVFEICDTHKTTRETPEPWFEIDAKQFLENTHSGTELQSAPPLRLNTQCSISTMTNLSLTENLSDVYGDRNKLKGTLTEKRQNLKNAKEACLYCARDDYICPSCNVLQECIKPIAFLFFRNVELYPSSRCTLPEGWNIPAINTETHCSNCKKELFFGDGNGYCKLRSPLHIDGSKKCICLFCWKFNFETIRENYYSI
tara:strand:- start:38 stop:1108 length:1071 start_codon:yes stop_codon:yes gene_type:complete